MTDRTCDFCRWWDRSHSGLGVCRRFPPVAAQPEVVTGTETFCGEWADATITPEQEERRQFVRQIFLAMTASEWGASYSEEDMWKLAGKLAAAEPQIQREAQR